MILTILKRIKKDCLVKTAAGQGTKHIISYLTAGRGTAQSRSPWTWWCSPVGSCLTPSTSSQSSPTWDPAGRWLTTINSTRFPKKENICFSTPSHICSEVPMHLNLAIWTIQAVTRALPPLSVGRWEHACGVYKTVDGETRWVGLSDLSPISVLPWQWLTEWLTH